MEQHDVNFESPRDAAQDNLLVFLFYFYGQPFSMTNYIVTCNSHLSGNLNNAESISYREMLILLVN